uniref:Uncharacterized protein n=1 Tax=Solanum tuberosum TaxID=4113 RepID=M1D9T0_SOLTU
MPPRRAYVRRNMNEEQQVPLALIVLMAEKVTLDVSGVAFQVDENPYEFIESIQKINEIMDVTLVDSAYLVAYPLKGVT